MSGAPGVLKCLGGPLQAERGCSTVGPQQRVAGAAVQGPCVRSVRLSKALPHKGFVACALVLRCCCIVWSAGLWDADLHANKCFRVGEHPSWRAG